MYKLTIDCGTANDVFLIDNKKDYVDYMKEFEEHYKGCTEELFEKGFVHCGIDSLYLEEVFKTYEISVDSLLCKKNETVENYYSLVECIVIDSNGNTEVHTRECWFEGGELHFEYEYDAEYSPQEIYKWFDLVGEDGKLFE